VAVALVERAREVERARVFDRPVLVAMRSRYPRVAIPPGSDTRARPDQNGQMPAMFSDAATLNGANPVTTAWMNLTVSTSLPSQ
jgi:hypothetical protein